jgi:glycerol-3-phosphate dehydrogenase
MRDFQVAIIGGGVIGSAIAWELSKYNIDVIVFEKGSDVASGSSKANSGVIHSGINSIPSSLKARFCVEGNQMFNSLANQLGFQLKWIGKYVIAKKEEEVKELEHLKEVGKKNNVPFLEIKNKLSVKSKEPNVACHAALWVPTAGIIEPYEFTISLAENAAENKINFLLETKVTDLKKQKNGFKIKTNRGEFQTQLIVNAAGLNCREIVSMLEKPDFNIYPCRGEYLVLDKNYHSLIKSMIYPVPKKDSGVLGIHLTPTIKGNILIGPSAEFIDDIDDKKTTDKTTKTLLKEAKEIIPELPNNSVINAYAGIRCKLVSNKGLGWTDYRIEESNKTPGLINLLGIESPGLTAAPAIAKKIVQMISQYIELEYKKKFKTVKKRKHFSELSEQNQVKLIKKDKRWGRIICRCEHVTEMEVSQALSNPLNSKTISSVKYRCRAGMGRCQGGFCTQHIIKIMENKFGMNINDIKLRSPDSKLFYGRTREVKDE